MIEIRVISDQNNLVKTVTQLANSRYIGCIYKDTRFSLENVAGDNWIFVSRDYDWGHIGAKSSSKTDAIEYVRSLDARFFRFDAPKELYLWMAKEDKK